MGNEIRVGLVGYGMAGRVFHAPVIGAVPGLRLTTVVERRTDDSSKRYPWVRVVRGAAELFDDDEVDLVVVATPTDTHFDLAKRALLAGKHVVVDKPFTTTTERAAELIELARHRGLILSVFHNRRWDGDFLTVRRLLGRGLLGRLVEFESHFDRFRSALRPGAWREEDGAGGGILYDLGVHLADQALVLFGPPSAVTADVRIQRDGAKADDCFEVILHYDRLKVTLKSTMLARTPGPRFLLHGTQGSFVKHGLDPQEDALKAGRTPDEPGWGEEAGEHWGALDTEVDGLRVAGKVETLPGCYQAFYQNVLDAIAGRAELAVRPEEAALTIRVVELARRSHEEKRTVAFAV
jgi:scyllo-inositol 2-dehydrogenase (NADP+)